LRIGANKLAARRVLALSLAMGIGVCWVFADSATTTPATTAATQKEFPGIERGKDGWLFFEGRRPAYDKEDDLAVQNAEVILDLHEQLKSVGIMLLVVPVPDQLYLARAHWMKPDRPFTRKHLDKAFDYLRGKGVAVLDSAKILDKMEASGIKTALTQDAHLTPVAYETLAAEATALVQKTNKFEGRPKDFTVIADECLEPASTAEIGKFDLLNIPVKINRVRHNKAMLVQARRGAELMIFGDSHVIEFSPVSASFSDHLAKDLAVVPDVRSRPGEGSGGTIRTEFARQKDNLEGTRVVVWSFLEGALILDGTWKKVQVIKK
jgi:hypothetical protein